jgi:hypothetical protein
MSANYYIGTSPDELLGNSPRFLYLIRRNDDGELFFVRSDQLRDKNSIEINSPGPVEENFIDFEPGFDFFEGIDENHEPEYKNLVWPQYKWDNRSVLYFVDEQGQLVQRINQNYTYPSGISS